MSSRCWQYYNVVHCQYLVLPKWCGYYAVIFIYLLYIIYLSYNRCLFNTMQYTIFHSKNESFSSNLLDFNFLAYLKFSRIIRNLSKNLISPFSYVLFACWYPTTLWVTLWCNCWKHACKHSNWKTMKKHLVGHSFRICRTQ